MSEKVYEMQWDCQFCGTEKLLGKTHRFCPNCGSPQNPDARYFPSDNQKVAVQDHIFVGVDVTCPSCGELNAGNAEFCQQCGAPMKDGTKANLVDSNIESSRDLVKEKFDAEMQRVGVQKKKNSEGFDKRIIAGVAVVIIAVIGIIAGLTITQEESVYVEGHAWEREIFIDEYRNLTESNWRDIRPAGDNVSMVFGSCVERQRSTRQVPDGETCSTNRVDNGDGTFREVRSCTTNYRSEPVYDDWCRWEGQRWESARTIPTSGNSLNDTPEWGNFTLSCAGQSRVGCERESNRTADYSVILQGDEHEYTCTFNDQDYWASFGMETHWTVNVRVIDNAAADCGSLAREQ